jgi:hypothetical protein
MRRRPPVCQPENADLSPSPPNSFDPPFPRSEVAGRTSKGRKTPKRRQPLLPGATAKQIAARKAAEESGRRLKA